jgi:nitrogen regulatory protein PII
MSFFHKNKNIAGKTPLEMPLINKVIKKGVLSKEENKPALPYEETHTLSPLGFLVVVVNEGQDGAIVKIVYDGGGAACFSCRGKGTASNDVYEVLGLSNTKKHVVMSSIPLSCWPKIKKSLEERFSISPWAKGLGILVTIDSVCGVSTYKFLSNTRSLEEGKGEKTMEPIQKKNDYEIIMAIVNDGFTDLVMDAAKKAGARGGTILTAHGTGNKDIEKFFGVVITPEKQIVMILVPKTIKDAVIASIYKEVGINTKGQGIAFSIPASDVVGIVEPNQANPEEAKVESSDAPTEGK